MWTLWTFAFVLLTATKGVDAYEVTFQYGDESTRACSGMWAGRDTFINVTLDKEHSTGQLEILVFEAADAHYIGRSYQSALSTKAYFCNPWDIKGGLCSEEERGHFLFDLPSGLSLSNTSIWTTRLVLPSAKPHSSFQPAGPVFAVQDQTMHDQSSPVHPLDMHNAEMEINYLDPVQYYVSKSGYYCLAYRPVLPAPPYKHPIVHSRYKGVILFRNTFVGKLSAADYAKLLFCAVIFSLYSLTALVWGSLYWRNRTNTLPIHASLSAILGLTDLYTLLMLGHFVIMNTHKRGHTSALLLLVAHVLRAVYYTATLAVSLCIGHGLSFIGGDGTFSRLAKSFVFCLCVLHIAFGTLYASGRILGSEYHVKQAVLRKFEDILIPLEVTTVIFVVWSVGAWIATLRRMSSRTLRTVRQKIIFTGCIFNLALATYLALHVYFLYLSINHPHDRQGINPDEWHHLWLTDGFAAGWRELVYMPALLATLWIWQPSKETFAYEEIPQSEDAAEAEWCGVQDAVEDGGDDRDE